MSTVVHNLFIFVIHFSQEKICNKVNVFLSQEIAKQGKVPLGNPVMTMGTAVLPAMGMLRGHFLAYIGQVNLWDVAGSIPILRRAGLEMRLRESQTEVKDLVTDGVYVLEEGSSRRWRLRGSLIVSTPEGIEYCRCIT